MPEKKRVINKESETAVPATTRIAMWSQRAKGIDDAALLSLPIQPVSYADWLRSLPLHFQQQVIATWQARGIPPPEI